MKGLADLYTVWNNGGFYVKAGGLVKTEYAQDEEGRLWRRTTHRQISTRFASWSIKSRWHVADCYAWFPGESPRAIEGARLNNRRKARPPKIDVYRTGDRYFVAENA